MSLNSFEINFIFSFDFFIQLKLLNLTVTISIFCDQKRFPVTTGPVTDLDNKKSNIDGPILPLYNTF